MRLGVNVDHVATVREARHIHIPDPLEAARRAEQGGADAITVHLREDRRHIQECDVELLRRSVTTKLNLEMAVTPEMMEQAERFKPDDVCLVPERREELTTEGGLDVVTHRDKVREVVNRLQGGGIRVSLFIDPQERQIEVSREIGAYGIEIHTGRYCDATDTRSQDLNQIMSAVAFASRLGLEIHGGHGLNYENVSLIARIPEIVELNIGHSIVARAIMVGMTQAVREMKDLLDRVRKS